MTNTADFIKNLAKETKPVKALGKPSYWILQFVILAFIYYIAAQIFLGVRDDIAQKFSQIFFVAEILLMLSLLLSCLVSSALMIYPDNYQKSYLLKIPYVILSLIVALFVVESFLQNEANVVVASTHNIRCSICIAAFALIPSLYFFYILRKGANINPSKAGVFAVIAAGAIGCIALRIAEQNDLLSHLILWHYVPVLIFSAIGAAAGRVVFRW